MASVKKKKIKDAPVTFATSVRPQTRNNPKTTPTYTKFHSGGTVLNSVDAFQFWLKSNQLNGHITQRPSLCVSARIFESISLIFVGVNSMSNRIL